MDQFDNPNFDPLLYLNTRFPDEASLAGLDDEIGFLAAELKQVETELKAEILEHALTSGEISAEIARANETSEVIIREIEEIRSKAAESEEVVYQMCKDLKSLDVAKRNLTGSIVALKKFIMLVNAYEKLRESCRTRNYKETANLVSAYQEMANHFNAYQEVPQMAELQNDYGQLIQQLKEQLQEDMEEFLVGKRRAEEVGHLCAVVEALGRAYLGEFIRHCSQVLVKPYIGMFEEGEHATLENTDRRYGWLKRRLEQYDSKFKEAVPESWNVPVSIYKQFCSITKVQLIHILDSKPHSVALLMKSLELTLKFQARAVEEVQARNRSTGRIEVNSVFFKGLISNCFQNFMAPYLKSEEENLLELVERNLAADRVDPSSELKSFSSAILTFNALKALIKRASSYSRGRLMQEVLALTKKMLFIYVQKLGERLQQTDRSKKEEMEARVCFIINTCEYCKDSISPLEELLSSSMDKEVALNEQNELFSTVISRGFDFFLGDLDGKLEQSLAVFSKSSFWEKLQSFEDSSAYVKEVNAILHSHTGFVKNILTPAYCFFYMNKLVVLTCNKLTAGILRLKKPSFIAIRQLQVDAGDLKVVLLSLAPKSTQKAYDKNLKSFKEFAAKAVAKIENLIKLLQMSEEQFCEKFIDYNDSATLQDLDRVLAVKGLRRADVQKLVLQIQTSHR